jgi:drug/metabolite transporter (DMT)-like permease
VGGVLLGLLGTVVLFLGRGGIGFALEYLPGFAAAFVAAFVWATYSVLSRRFAGVPTDAVAGFCLATAVLAAICHLALETTVWPDDAVQWLAVVALGIGPVGAAFYAWDVGVKRGDIRVLGAGSYAAPILSTFLLVLAGYAAGSLSLALAAALITGGGLLAAKDLLTRNAVPTPSEPARSR